MFEFSSCSICNRRLLLQEALGDGHLLTGTNPTARGSVCCCQRVFCCTYNRLFELGSQLLHRSEELRTSTERESKAKQEVFQQLARLKESIVEAIASKMEVSSLDGRVKLLRPTEETLYKKNRRNKSLVETLRNSRARHSTVKCLLLALWRSVTLENQLSLLKRVYVDPYLVLSSMDTICFPLDPTEIASSPDDFIGEIDWKVLRACLPGTSSRDESVLYPSIAGLTEQSSGE
ncbi:hypothetical protein HAX54_025308 [Datura stramonium]|uniref:Uncharacterized protein n=1 Tax=Datura stramonium TaxID=4076 RepID=A0ABS8V1S7_DATST|nr:hypothetical protein [Datura stramonium]